MKKGVFFAHQPYVHCRQHSNRRLRDKHALLVQRPKYLFANTNQRWWGLQDVVRRLANRPGLPERQNLLQVFSRQL